MMNPCKLFSILRLSLIWIAMVPSVHGSASAGTTFGTVIWGRNCTGQPHWLDGSVYPGVDVQSRLDGMLYVPLDPQGNPAATSSDPKKLAKGSYDCARLDYW
jgi:hypothetical protein